MVTNPVQSPTTTPKNSTTIKPTSSPPAAQPTGKNTGTTGGAANGAYKTPAMPAGWGNENKNDPFSGSVTSIQYPQNLSRHWKLDEGTGNFRTDSVAPAKNTFNSTSPWGNVMGQYSPRTGDYYNAFSETADQMTDRGVERMSGATAGQMDPREVAKSIAAAMGIMDPRQIEQMQAALAAENNRTVNANEMSSTHLNDILAQDSPLMSLARQSGIDYSQRRGTANSSLAGGAAMAEMARQATPLAMQQAETHRAAQTQNQQLESARRDANANREQQSNLFNADSANQAYQQEFASEAARREANAGREQIASNFNADAENQALQQEFVSEAARREADATREQQARALNADAGNQALQQQFDVEAERRKNNAALLTNTNLQNAAMSNEMMAKESANKLSYALQQLSGDQDFVRQNMASSLSKQLAEIEGEHKKFISNNDSAARMVTQYMDSMSDLLSNKDMNRDEALKRVEDMTIKLKDTLNVMDAISGLDLGSRIMLQSEEEASSTGSASSSSPKKNNTRGANS